MKSLFFSCRFNTALAPHVIDDSGRVMNVRGLKLKRIAEMDIIDGHLPASRLIVLRSPSPPRAPSVLMGHDGGLCRWRPPSERHACRFHKDTGDAAFAPPRANMVLAASATAFERPHCVPVVVRERRTPDLCDRLIPSSAWGARGWDRGAIDGGVEAPPRCTAAVRASAVTGGEAATRKNTMLGPTAGVVYREWPNQEKVEAK